MINGNIYSLTFKVSEVEFKPNGESDAIPELIYMLIDSQTSEVISQSAVFEPSQVSNLPSISLETSILIPLIISFYMVVPDGKKLLGSASIDFSIQQPKKWLKIPSDGDEVLSIEIEIIKKELIEAPNKSIYNSKIIQESENLAIFQSDVLSEENKINREESIEAPQKSLNESETIQENEKCENLQSDRKENKFEEEMSDLMSLYQVENINDIAEKIEDAKESIKFYNKKKKYDKVKKKREKLAGLERLLELHEKIKASKNVEETKQNASTLEEENLDEELNKGLKKYDIENSQKLEKEINNTKTSISFYENKGKIEKAAKQKNILSDLEKLHSIYRKLSLKSMIIIDSKEVENQKKIEFIEAMINDISTMPICIEQSLTSVLCFAYCKRYNVCLSLDIKEKFDSIDLGKAFDYSFNYLNHNHKGIIEGKHISNFKQHFQNENWDLLIKETENIFKDYVRPLNVNELSRLINKSAQCSGNLENKDIILLIGFTGSGKSTTTHFLCGSKMEKILEDSVTHIKPTAIKNPLLKNVTISSRAESETRCITAIPITIDTSQNSQEVVYICDTPGLMDTNGAEVDITNTISIVECVRKCRSVRPLILLSSKAEGDRFEGFKKLAHTLARLVPNFKKYSKSFTYAFTKYSQEDAKNIHALVENSLELLRNDYDEVFLKILEDIKDKTEIEVIRIDPLKDDPQELLRKIMESQEITDVKDAFERFLTCDSSRSIKSQIDTYSKCIQNALDPINYEIIGYSLNRLQYLASLFIQFKHKYDENVDNVIKKTKILYDNAIEKFNKIIDNNEILDENDVSYFKKVHDNLKASEEIRTSHLKCKTTCSEAIPTHFISKLSLADANIESNKTYLQLQLKNTKILSTSFEEINSHYEHLCQEYRKLIENLQTSAESYLKADDFENFTKVSNKIKNYFEIFSDSLDFVDFYSKLCELLNQFKSKLHEICDKSTALLDKGYVEKADIDMLQQNLSIIQSAIEAQCLKDLIDTEEINKLNLSIIAKWKEYFEAAFSISRTESLYEANIQTKFEEYNLLIDVPEIKVEITPYYDSILEFITNEIKSLMKNAKEMIRTFIKSPNPISLESLGDCLKKLKSLEWIENFAKEVNCNVLPKIENKIKKFNDELLFDLKNIDLDIKSYSKINEAYLITCKSHIIIQLKELIPSACQYDKIVSNEFNRKIEETVKSIKKMFNPGPKDFKKENKIIEKLSLMKQEYLQYVNQGKIDKAEEIIKIDKFMTIEGIDQEISKNKKIIEEKKTRDIDILENSYNYIEECKKLREMPDSILQILFSNIFSDLYQLYNGYLHSLTESFKAISDYFVNDSNIDMDNLKSLTCNFSSTFNKISILNEKSPSFFKTLENESCFLQCKNDLNTLYINAFSKLRYLFGQCQMESLSSLLIIFNELASVNTIFLNLLTEYNNLQCSEIKELLDLIEKHKFHESKIIIDKLDKSTLEAYKGTISNKLLMAIDSLIKSMKNLINNFNPDQIEQICSIYKTIDCAKQNNLYIYFDNETKEKLSFDVKDLKKKLEGKIFNYLSLITKDINENKVYEAEAKLKFFSYLVRDGLGYIFPVNFNFIISRIDCDLNDLPEKIIKQIRDREIKELKEYPLNNILQNFDKASKSFRDSANKVKNLITEKLNNIGNNFAKESIINRTKISDDISSILKFLPKNISDLAKNVKNKIQESINKEKKNFKDEVDEYSKSKKIKELCKLYKQSSQYQSESSLKYAKKILRKIINSTKYEIFSALKQKNWEVAFDKAHILALEKEIKEIIVDSDKVFKEIYQHLRKFICEILNNLVSIKHKDKSTDLSESFKFYKSLMNFKIEIKINDIFEINSTIESVHANISEFYCGLNNSFTEFKPPNNPMKCNDTLNKIKEFDDFLKNFQEYMSQSSLYPIYDSKIKNQWRYSQFKIDLTSQLIQLDQYFIELKVPYEDIKIQALLQKNAKRIQEKWNEIKSFCYLKNHLEPNIDPEVIKSNAIKSIFNEMGIIKKAALSLINKAEIRKEGFDKIRNYYNFLEFFEKNLKIKALNLKNILKAIEDRIYKKTIEFKAKAENGERIEEKVEAMLNMKEISNNFPSFKSGLDKILDDFLGTLGKNNKRLVCSIIGELEKHENGLYIITEHKFFEGVMQMFWQKKTQAHGIKYVLEHIKGSHLNIQELQQKYEEYDEWFLFYHKKYQGVIRDQSLKHAINQIVAEIKISSKAHEITFSNLDFSLFKQIIPNLLAQVSILWELCNIEKYNQDINSNDEIFLLHPIQVLSIFRMIGIGYEEGVGFENNLVQILTGEGKSITLAFLSSMLALLGFTVNCACYSEHLSKRDFEEFEPLYTALNICSYVKYGTFNKLCEDEINSNGEIRSNVLDLIRFGHCSNMIYNATERPKILVIDEVDVFFAESFYGNIYRPLAKLKDPAIKALTDYIWKSRESLKNLDIKSTKVYKNCCSKFPGFEFLIREAVNDMKCHIHQFKSHDYIVKNDKIGYKEHDGISFNKTYGYNTLFAYYFEHENGRITQKSRDENVFIGIQCGMFSYARIPYKFNYIMGVTGTLETLGNHEKYIIESEYNIKLQTFMPSAFGENRRIFGIDRDVYVENNENYYLTIMNEINEKIGKIGSKRAVLVYFEDEAKLMNFYNESTLKQFDFEIQLITESLSAEDRGMMIKKATVPNTVTLLIRVFGRGIDFKCLNQEVENSGGVHVIQTFFSEDISEETQIKGRTARQGQKGSYNMVLLDKDLEKFLVSEEEISKMRAQGSFYSNLNRKREQFNDKKNESQSNYLKDYEVQHNDSIGFLNYMYSNDVENVKTFLQALNKGQSIDTEIYKIIILMDATGSMSNLLQNAKNTVKKMLQRVCDVLLEKEINPDCFQLQYCAYRNYSSSEDKILQVSPWTNKSDVLERFLKYIKSEGGQGNEAIEVGLWHVNNVIKDEIISQVILIGDKPPNTIENIQEKRNRRSDYWNNTKFKNVEHYRRELAKIIERNVHINAFYVEPYAQKKFQKIARLTGGKCEYLNINSNSGAERLTDLVATQILFNAGGEEAVKLYWKNYPITYT